MALVRVAARGGRANEVLPLVSAGRHAPQTPRHAGEAALAHRARLPGDEGRSRAGPFRGPHLERLSPPRHALHGGPRLPRAPSSAFPTGGGFLGHFPRCVGGFNICCCAASAIVRCASADSALALLLADHHASVQVVLIDGPWHAIATALKVLARTLRRSAEQKPDLTPSGVSYSEQLGGAEPCGCAFWSAFRPRDIGGQPARLSWSATIRNEQNPLARGLTMEAQVR